MVSNTHCYAYCHAGGLPAEPEGEVEGEQAHEVHGPLLGGKPGDPAVAAALREDL